MQKAYRYIPERPAHNVFHLIPPIHHSGGKFHQYVLIPVCSRLFRPDCADYTITVILLSDLPLSSPDRQNQSDRCYHHRSMDLKSSRNHYYGWKKRSNYTPESAPELYHQDSSGLLLLLIKPVLLRLYRLSILSLFSNYDVCRTSGLPHDNSCQARGHNRRYHVLLAFSALLSRRGLYGNPYRLPTLAIRRHHWQNPIYKSSYPGVE